MERKSRLNGRFDTKEKIEDLQDSRSAAEQEYSRLKQRCC